MMPNEARGFGFPRELATPQLTFFVMPPEVKEVAHGGVLDHKSFSSPAAVAVGER